MHLAICQTKETTDHFGPFSGKALAQEWLDMHTCTVEGVEHRIQALRVSAPGHANPSVTMFNTMKGEPGYGQEPK